jgi:D-3-phosphoglycerate dehydrogenase
MFRILNCEPDGYSAKARAVLEQAGSVVEKRLARAGLLRELNGFDALIVRLANQVDAEVMDAAPSLKLISSATTGVDHIDLRAAAERGIEVITLRGENEFLDSVVATAEHTWALLLSLIRKVPAASDSVRAGGWDRDAFKGTELRGKRLGILGLGRLGTKVANYGSVFGMRVFAFDPYRSDWPSNVRRCNSLDELLKVSDVLTIHVPLNENTSGMIGRKELEALPRGSILINTSRANIVDETAVAALLDSGHLAGAGIDVVTDERNETARRANPLLRYYSERERTGNLIVTPHIGGATFESMEMTEIFMAHKLLKFVSRSDGS